MHRRGTRKIYSIPTRVASSEKYSGSRKKRKTFTVCYICSYLPEIRIIHILLTIFVFPLKDTHTQSFDFSEDS